MNSVIVVGSFNVDHVWRCAELPAMGATIAYRHFRRQRGQAIATEPPAGDDDMKPRPAAAP